MKNFDQCKDEVAKKKGYPDFDYVMANTDKLQVVKINNQAAELYAQEVAKKWTSGELEILKDLYVAAIRYESKMQGLMAWELPSLEKARKILEENKVYFYQPNQEKP